jgi:hypothetical protein
MSSELKRTRTSYVQMRRFVVVISATFVCAANYTFDVKERCLHFLLFASYIQVSF